MMRKVLIAAVLAGFATLAWGQFPDLLRQVIPQIKPPGSTAPSIAPQAPAPQPSVGAQLFGDTSAQEEISIGRQLAGNLLGAAPLVKDDQLQNYVNKVGRAVAAQSERPDLNWYFGVLETNDINAFALPGGYVFVTRGLYLTLNNEAELAGVLGHEIAHVVQKHHLKLLQQSSVVGTVGGILGSQLRSRNPLANAAGQNLIGNGAEAIARGLDKGAEYEADRMGVVLAARTGYDPYGLPVVLQKIAQINPGNASLALLFKTHPLPQERLVKLGEAMGDSFDRYADGKALSERFYALKK